MAQSETGFARQLVDAWYKPGLDGRVLLLVPLAWLYRAITAVRRGLFRLGLKKSARLPVPTIVIGNITAGGSGKTPLTIYLAQALLAAGFKPGIISRGYGGAALTATLVTARSDPAMTGDEPVLMAQATGVPVMVGRDRVAAGLALLAAHPDVNVILCDDGLQHYRLQRDIELCVIDGARGLGNGQLIPAGPLREGRGRLRQVDAVIVNGEGTTDWHPRTHTMQLQPGPIYHLQDPTRTVTPAALAGQTLHAMAGIGNPARFFATLSALGLHTQNHAFADHQRYTAADLPADGLIITTEKDAVKLTSLSGIALTDDRIRVLPVRAQLDDGLMTWLAARILEVSNGRQAA
ncbi:tetraacyldisaccharide 4'-kinase [Silvimonas iriomotensis]|uniref:Tetraacyldisaccharide 4'-kinase n=1 Tax=Silvimonas iriomotensis TaxID=449662 RepID=A0ABQ2P9X5_9NEIS|nr:tetraacyldisaccharide 4'-kinase [Silvimonas iriomotensis]GGP21411.1 tetraacyldisaccharide 4'-kinase [Silvimonas iriomotensis]